MRAKHLVIAALLCAATSYYEGDGHPQEDRVAAKGEECRAKLGHALGTTWADCVISSLLKEQAAALRAGSDEYFPLVRHTYEPLAPSHTREPDEPADARRNSDLLKNLLRNFT